MPKVTIRNMEKRHQTWYALLRVPVDCRAAMGKAVLIQTTGKQDAAKAAPIAGRIVAGWKEEIAATRGHRTEHLRDAIQMTLPPRLAREKMIEAGLLPMFCDRVEEWRKQLSMKPRQADQYESDVRLFGAENLTIGEALEAAQPWFKGRLNAGDSAKTVVRRLAAIRNYWRWMVEKGYVSGDPFRDVKAPKVVGKRQSKRAAFTPAEVVKLRKAASNDDPMLGALIWIAAHTGGRIEELCKLAVPDVDLAAGTIRLNSKTDAGDRLVPMHSTVRPLMELLLRHPQNGQWLIHSTADNRYGERSVPLGKRFGRLKTKMGFGPERVFHSIRKTVATLFKDAGCPEPIAADILGHELQTMTYGVYSAGSRMETRRAWVEKAVRYPAAG